MSGSRDEGALDGAARILLGDLRPSQAAAVRSTARRIVVDAGAGTGKTHTLASRFAWLAAVDPGIPPERILTLTFTEKAAREMRERIERTLAAWEERWDAAEAGRADGEAPLSAEVRANLARARSGCAEAPISTIHAFALRTIREAGLSLDLDPACVLLSPPEVSAFDARMIRALDELDPTIPASLFPERSEPTEGDRPILRQDVRDLFDAGRNPALADMVNAWGATRLALSARAAAELIESEGERAAALFLRGEALRRGEVPPSFAAAARRAAAALLPRARALKERWNRAMEACAELLEEARRNPRSSATGRAFAEAVASALPAAPVGAEGPIGEARRLAGEFRSLWEGPLRSLPRGKLLEALAEALGARPGDFRDGELKPLGLLLESVSLELSPRERELTSALLRLAGIVGEALAEEKRRSGRLSFSDLIRLAGEVVRGGGGSDYGAILVDEAQDTDPLQDALLRSLGERAGASLFRVGDFKQSIYRFRHAEPALFAEAIRESREGPDGAYLPLRESFRMRPTLMDFVNALFGEIWREGLARPLPDPEDPRGGSGDPLPYEGLLFPETGDPGREERDASDLRPCELLLAPYVPLRGGSASEGREPEGVGTARGRLTRALARRLREAREAPGPGGVERRSVPGREGFRSISWRDMAILVPSRSDYPPLEAALEAEGIPALFDGARTFFARGEVGDLCNLLSACADPEDETALLSWIASPLSGLPAGTAGELAGALASAPGAPNAPSPAARLRALAPGAAARLAALRSIGLTEGPAALLEEAGRLPLLPEAGAAPLPDWSAAFPARASRRERATANLRRAAAMAREYEAAFGTDLLGCAEYLRDALARELPAEEPSLFDEEADAVRIMTVHAAKGLEFPLVALVGLERVPGSGRRELLPLSRDLGLLPLSLLPGRGTPPGGEGRTEEEPTSPEEGRPLLRGLLRVLEEEAEEEERQRLLYVAATRAKESLILAGAVALGREGKPSIREGSWLSLLAPLVAPGARLEGEGDLFGAPVTLLPAGGQGPEETSPPPPTAPEGPPGRPAPEREPGPEPAPGPRGPLPLPPARPELLRLFASGYALFRFCPHAWRLKYRRGRDLAYDSREEGPGGADLGSLAHRILARWDFDPDSLEALLPEELSPRADRDKILRCPPELRGVLRDDRARRSLRGWLLRHGASPEGAELRRRLREEGQKRSLFREIAFRLPLALRGGGEALLVGAIDLMILDPDRIRLRDYKTADPAGAPVDLYRHQLRFYALAAAEGLARGLGPFAGAGKGRPVETEILFLRAGDPREGGAPALLREGPQETEAIREDLLRYAREAAGGPFAPARDRCPACPFATHCRFGKGKDA